MVVVGAGIAGLAAAGELARAGLETVVLEARRRIGGRVVTDRSTGVPLNLGAAWIHGARGNPIADIVARHGLRTATTDHLGIAVVDPERGALSDGDTLREVKRVIAMANELIALAPTLGEDVSVEDVVRDRWRDADPALARTIRLALRWMTIVMAADPSRLSGKHWAQDDDDLGPDLFMVDGYDRVPEVLGRGLDVRTGHVVRRIAQDAHGVIVETEDRSFSGEAAVVTLPLGVLQEGSVAFEPALPEEKRQAIARLGMGLLNRLSLRFERAFWPEAHPHIVPLVDDAGPIAGFHNLLAYGSSATLDAWTAGEAARKLERETDAHVAEVAMKLLRRTFGRSVPDPVGVHVTRWLRDPFARGSYSYLPVGARGRDYGLAAAPAGRLVFAGEHTTRAHPSTVHGAYLSGVRAAGEIIRSVRSGAGT